MQSGRVEIVQGSPRLLPCTCGDAAKNGDCPKRSGRTVPVFFAVAQPLTSRGTELFPNLRLSLRYKALRASLRVGGVWCLASIYQGSAKPGEKMGAVPGKAMWTVPILRSLHVKLNAPRVTTVRPSGAGTTPSLTASRALWGNSRGEAATPLSSGGMTMGFGQERKLPAQSQNERERHGDDDHRTGST